MIFFFKKRKESRKGCTGVKFIAIGVSFEAQNAQKIWPISFNCSMLLGPNKARSAILTQLHSWPDPEYLSVGSAPSDRKRINHKHEGNALPF